MYKRQVSICLAQIGMQQFARVFLRLRLVWPRGNRISLAFIAFYLMLGLASFWLPYRIATPVAAASVFFSITWILTVTLAAYRRGDRSALLFLLAWGMFLLGTGMFTALAFGCLLYTSLAIRAPPAVPRVQHCTGRDLRSNGGYPEHGRRRRRAPEHRAPQGH